MNRKWIGFAATAALIVAFGCGNGRPGPHGQEKHKEKEKETQLGKIMEKVQKHNIAITKATRNATQFSKSQKDVESAARARQAGRREQAAQGRYLKNAKNEPFPDKKWDEIMDAFAKTSKELAAAAAKKDTTQKAAKDLFQSVKKTCSDCHTVFRSKRSSDPRPSRIATLTLRRGNLSVLSACQPPPWRQAAPRVERGPL